MHETGADAATHEMEKRYELMARRVHSKLLHGTLTDLEEVEFRKIDRSYKEWLESERARKLEAYRQERYGRFRTFSGLAEKIDEFLYYYKYHVLLLTLLGIMLVLGMKSYAFFRDMEMQAAARPAPDLTVLVVGDFADPPSNPAIQEALQQQLPSLSQIEVKSLSIPVTPTNEREAARAERGAMVLLSEQPDVYLVEQNHFIKLLQLGYVEKLESWDNYGINLADGPLGQIIPFAGEPLIAAVGVSAKEPEKALDFIQAFVTPDVQAAHTPDALSKPDL